MPVAYHRPVSSKLTIITRYISLDRWAIHADVPDCIWDSRGSRQISMQAWLLGSLLAETIRKYKVGFRCLYPFCIMAYLLTWLTLITITTGMCLMNAYELVKVRPALSSKTKRRKQTDQNISLSICFLT